MKLVSPASSQCRPTGRVCRYACVMKSQWNTNVNKARPRQAPTWRKNSSEHISWWFESVNGFMPSLCMSRKLSEACIFNLQSEIWQSNRESPWQSWRYLICIITCGLCSYNAHLFNDDVMAIGVSYWWTREFPNYARLHRGRICYVGLCCYIKNP